MLSKFKKFLSLVILLFCFILLLGCNTTLLDEAKNHIVNGLETEVVNDLSFIKEYQGVKITYTSSDTSVITNEGVVSRKDKDQIVYIDVVFEYQGEKDSYKHIAIVRAKDHEKEKPEDILARAKNYISTLIPTDVYEDLEFVYEYLGVKISYSSSNTNVLTNTGIVTKQTTEVDLVLTINFEYVDGEDVYKDSYIVYITVQPKEKVVEDYVDDIKRDVESSLNIINNVVTGNLELKTTSLYSSEIKWTSSDESLISLKGVVAKNIDSQKVKLTYTITYQGNQYGPYEFDLTVVTNKLDYYSTIKATSGNALKNELRSLITTTHKNKLSYDDLKSDTAKTDKDPNKPGNIILFYSRRSVSAKWDGGNTWNREHVWPQSKGWFKTSGAGADIHHIRPTNPSINSSRGSKPFSEGSSNSIFEPSDEVKGDVARILFYLLVRYSEADGYSITQTARSMEMLLEWNRLDPVDELERTRNEEAAKIQGNRNPFIDDVNYAEMIWSGSKNLSNTYITPQVEIILVEYNVNLNDIKEYIFI